MKYAPLIGLVGLLAPCATAQTSELFVTDYDSAAMAVVQGGSVIRSWNNGNSGENALAVSGTIRTGGSGVSSYGGAEYDLFGTPLGSSYSMPAVGNWYDGTTDGIDHNYAVQHNGDYNLYAFDRDWSNPQALFSVGFATSGITYDMQNGTLWVSDGLTRVIRQLDMAGNVLSTFTASQGTYAYGLAMDPADQTLWVGDFSNNIIHQYDQVGNFLGSATVTGLNRSFGMEFNIVPAPGSVGALALGGLLGLRRRRG